MKNKIIIAFCSILFLSFTACEKLALEPNPSVDNISIYEEYWKLFNEKYAMFEPKQVDWQNLYNITRPLVNNQISPDSLFTILGSMTIALRDGHTVLIDHEKGVGAFFNLEAGYPNNLDETIITQNYLTGNVQTAGDGLTYTTLNNGEIGYIAYRDFEKEVTTEYMNTILEALKDTKGIILDVRGNGGGDPSYAQLMASHFTENPTYIGYEQFKTGPAKNDFSRSDLTLQPTDGTKYLKPLMVLTNRQCYSATTTLIYSLNPLPQVKFIGGRTGGGSGSVADGQLANGWYYSLSTSEFIDYQDRHLDDGFDPDINVALDSMDMTKDELIERAIQEIN